MVLVGGGWVVGVFRANDDCEDERTPRHHEDFSNELVFWLDYCRPDRVGSVGV
jgi:hypothetical protein